VKRKEVVPLLLRRVPELQDDYVEHGADNDELIPRVFFGDASRFILSRARPQATTP
jgi:hypothetical protein